MADVDFASQLLQHSNTRIQTKLNEQITRATELRQAQTKALLDKINETDPAGNPVLDSQGVSDALDQIQKMHGSNSGIKDIVAGAKNALTHIHAIMGAPPQVREQLHMHAKQIAEKLKSEGEGGDTHQQLTDMAQQDAVPGQVGGAEPNKPLPASPNATVTPAQQAAAALPPPPQQGQQQAPAPEPAAPAAAPQAAAAAPTPAAQVLPAPPALSTVPATPSPAGHGTNPIANILAQGRTKMNPLALYNTEQGIAHSNALELARAQGDITRGNEDAKLKLEHTNRMAEIAKEVELRKLSIKYINQDMPDGTRHIIAITRNPTTQEEISREDVGETTKPASLLGKSYYKDASGKIYSARRDPKTNQPMPGTENYGDLPPAGFLPTFGTHQIVTVDPNTGQATLSDLVSTSQKGGVNTGGAGGAVLPPPPISRNQGGGAGDAGGAGGTGRSGNGIVGMPVGLYGANVAREIPLREAYTQIIGSPQHPNLTSLKDFAGIADDPARSKKLNAAVKATFDPIDIQEKAHGGILSYISLVGGLPQAINQAQSGANAKLIRDNLAGDPELQQAYNSIMTAYSNVVALRAFNKSSAAEFSVKQLENELPIPGGNSFSSRDFYDKMAKLALNIENVSRKTPTMGEDERKYITETVDNLSRLSKGTAITPPPNGTATKGTGGAGSTGGVDVKYGPKTYHFPDQKGADAFKKEMKIP